MTFWYGSGSADSYLWLTDQDPAPDPALFASDPQDANKKFFAYYFLKQCFGSGFIEPGSGSSIASRIRIQGFEDKNCYKNFCWNFFLSSIHLSLDLHKVGPSYRRRFHPLKENIQREISYLFSIFVGYFCLPGSGFGIRIPNPDLDQLTWLNSDLKHCFEATFTYTSFYKDG